MKTGARLDGQAAIYRGAPVWIELDPSEAGGDLTARSIEALGRAVFLRLLGADGAAVHPAEFALRPAGADSEVVRALVRRDPSARDVLLPANLGDRGSRAHVLLRLTGPSGGVQRQWNTTVAVETVAGVRSTERLTSTAGWRQYRGPIDEPLPWLADVDRDGATEVVLWSSAVVVAPSRGLHAVLFPKVYRIEADRLRHDADAERPLLRGWAARVEVSARAQATAQRRAVQEALAWALRRTADATR